MDETDGIPKPATIEAAPPMICFECGYPAPRARCPECGGALVPRSSLVDSRRNVHRLAILFAGVVTIDVLQILIRISNPNELLDVRIFDLLSDLSRAALLAITAMSVGYLIGLLRWRGRLDRNLAAIDGAS